MSRRRRGTRGSGVNVTNFSAGKNQPSKFACQACLGRKDIEDAFRQRAQAAGQDYLAFEGNVVFAAPGTVVAASFIQGHETGLLVINAGDAAAFGAKIAEFGALILATDAAEQEVPDEAPIEEVS